MQSTLEKNDIDAIAEAVFQKLKPLLKVTSKKAEDDVFFSVDQLAEHLNVKKCWIYRRTSEQTIPFHKRGRYVRFKKSEIDKWLEEQKVNPLPKH
jgi:excisionase family DNA binding protein